MYRQHFGLKKRPFDSGIARDGDVYVGPAERAALRNLNVALSTLDSAVVLVGPPGVGKTTLACAALREENTRLTLGWLGNLPADPQDAPELLLAEFGVAAPRAGRIGRLQLWRQFLSEMGATETRVLVIVEHADEVPVPVLRALESLTAADPNGCPGANLVLTGRAQLTELLRAPALQALRQRVRLRQPLAPLSPEDTASYVRHRLQAAGGRPELFPPAALRVLHRYSDGVPRVLNNLCETALTVAATSGANVVDPGVIVHVAEELFGLVPGAGLLADEDEPANAHVAASPANAEADVPVLTDAVDADDAEPGPAPAFERLDGLLDDARLEAKRTERVRDEKASFSAAAAALAQLANDDTDELGATTLLAAARR